MPLPFFDSVKSTSMTKKQNMSHATFHMVCIQVALLPSVERRQSGNRHFSLIVLQGVCIYLLILYSMHGSSFKLEVDTL